MSDRKFDICIVGAGASGLEIARLASRAGLCVALVEQGASDGRHIFQRVPLMVGKIIGNPKFVKAWQSVPQMAAGETTRPVLAGRGLGGSSRTNGNVAYAGHADRYAAVFGQLGLDFTDVLSGLSQSSGDDMPRVPTWTDELSHKFIKAAVTKGARSVDDPDLELYGAAPLHVSTKRGLRYNYLDGFRANAAQAKISIIRAAARHLIWDANSITGVMLATGETVRADHVVASAGAIGSPELLMRSGIGDATMLNEAGIDPRHDVPAVGLHLKDHANLRIPFSCPAHDTLNQKTRGLAALKEGLKFLLGSDDTVLRGPGASAGVNVNATEDYRIQLVHFTQDRSKVASDGIVFEREQGASLGMYALWPHSEGSVRLTSQGLDIDPGFLSDARDVDTTRTALDHARKLIAQMGFAPRDLDQTDEEFIRNGVYSGYHLIGSNRMGVDAQTSVVGPNFAVHGMNGLSVCDASVLPDHVSSHSYLPSVAMARMFAAQQGWGA